MNKQPKLTIVGAGPGDAELITLKAINTLKEADVVLFDALVNPQLLGYINPKAEKIFVGKRRGCYRFQQEQINELIVEKALALGHVVRLKGGDPSIFGRAAEETTHLQTLGINFAIVPGVTAASGCAAWSGLPLTLRETAHSVRFVTAHFKNDKIKADWENYAECMLEDMQSAPGYENMSETNDYVPRPDSRPLTKFENRGQRLGHGVWDLQFKRKD